MADIHHASPKDGDVLLLVGTTKGAFVMRSNGARARWDVAGPYFHGQQIYAMAFDQRGDRQRLLAGGSSDHWGPVLHTSDDFGRNWSNPEKGPVRFPDDAGASVKRVWQIMPGRKETPDVVYAGVEPSALFESHDGGESWSLSRGLWDHPHRPTWQPGGGGLCLHTILPDPTNRNRMTVAMSTGGVYRTEDGGKTWKARNQGVRAEYQPEKYPEYGQCVHKVVMHPSRPERLFLQNHWGLYRSENGGDSWQDVANGVPSDFGFAMAMHPHDADTVYIVPIESDMFRCTPDARLRVYRTRNAGASWEALTKGLPQKDALETVLRDGMATDPVNPAGVYFGTRSGSVWGSTDGGASWREILTGVPPVICVKTAVVGDAAKVRVPKPAKSVAKAKPRAQAKTRAKSTKRAAPRTKSGGRTKKRAAKRGGRRSPKKK